MLLSCLIEEQCWIPSLMRTQQAFVSHPRWGSKGAEPLSSSGRVSKGNRIEIGSLWRLSFPVFFSRRKESGPPAANPGGEANPREGVSSHKHKKAAAQMIRAAVHVYTSVILSSVFCRRYSRPRRLQVLSTSNCTRSRSMVRNSRSFMRNFPSTMTLSTSLPFAA